MITKPFDMLQVTGVKFKTQLMTTEITEIIATGLHFFATGTTIAINIACKAIPKDTHNVAGKKSPLMAPKKVPKLQANKGNTPSPYIYFLLISFSLFDATTKISSVTKKAIASLLKNVVDGSIFCDRETDISEYRMFITNWVRTISTNEALATIRPMPANCPADVRFVIEISTEKKAGIPRLDAKIPKEKDTER